ncbi:MAG: hypothetical protein IPL61_23380 [Myxococcales bacterium]|nr:hypothetical protein [Myxococcales bacterium]
MSTGSSRLTPALLAALLALATVASASTARAQAVAVDPAAATAASPPRPHGHPHAGFGGGVAFGFERQRGRDDGWLARIDYEMLPVLTPRGRFGGFFGFLPALQLWRAGDDWGVGVPFAFTLGVRAPGLRAGVLFGVEAMLVDQVADDTGFGLYAPLAGARVNLDLGGWYAGADARVTRRWQFGAPDYTQWQASAVLGYTWETPLRAPVR